MSADRGDLEGRARLTASIQRAPSQLMQRVVDEALMACPSADGAVVELVDGTDELLYVWASGLLSDQAGIRLRRGTSMSGLAIATNTTLRADDTFTDARVDRAACERLGTRSMVCVPLHGETGAVGVLKVSSSQPHSFGDGDVQLLSGLADFITTLAVTADRLSVASKAPQQRRRRSDTQDLTATAFVSRVLGLDHAERGDVRRRVEGLPADSNGIKMVGQPIVELATGDIVGIEALARFTTEPPLRPETWFADAKSCGLGVELELCAVRLAFAERRDLPKGPYMAVNVGPDTMIDQRLLSLVGTDASGVVIELTEHERVDELDALAAAASALRERGARLATDDTGAGFSGLTRMLRLKPEYIKLDRELIIGIETDSSRLALAAALVRFAHDTGATLIAEGIETPNALEALIGVGVQYGQGYQLARPMPFATLAQLLAEHTGVHARPPR